MKKKGKLIVLLIAILTLFGCTGKNEEKDTYDLSGKTYYNTVDEYGNNDHSRIWFGKDGSFVLTDNFYDGYYEATGTWSVKENVCTLEVKETGVGSFDKIVFEIQDEDTLILKTTLAGSKPDQIFSTKEIKGSDDSGNGKSDDFVYTIYYNSSQTTKNVSYVEIRSDKSFGFIDQNDFGVYEVNGTYTKENDYLHLESEDKSIKIDFLIKDKNTMILQNDVGVSATGDVFTSDYKKPEAPASVPCTGLSSLYHNYWAVEGTKNYNLEVKPTPLNTSDKIYYKSNDEKVVTVDDIGNASAISPGKTTIDITCGSQKLSVGFETRAKGPSSIELHPSYMSLNVDGSDQLTAKVLPLTADLTVTFKSKDSSIATVDNYGIVKGKSPGVTDVTASTVNGLTATSNICVEGETVIFEMENNVSVKASSGQKIPYKATHIACYDGVVNKSDVTEYVDFHTAYTSALDIDGHGNVYAKGAVYESVDIDCYFTYSDGSSFYVTSQNFVVHVEK